MPTNRRKLIQLAEYAALTASVAGAIATFQTQQPLFVAVPLTLLAAISLVSRQQQSQQVDRLLQQSAQQIEADRLHIQRLQQSGDDVRSEFLEHQKAYEATMETLHTRVLDQGKVAAAMARLVQRLDSKADAVALQQLVKQLEAQAEKNQQIDQAIKGQAAKINQAVQSIQDLAHQTATISTPIDDQIDTLTDYLNGVRKLLEAEIKDTQQRINTLTSQTATRVDRDLQTNRDLQALWQDLEARLRQLEERENTLLREPTEKEEPAPAYEKEPRRKDFRHIVPQLPTVDDFDLDIQLGIDFGTGYTKVCFRDIARDRSEVVTFAQPAETGLTLEQTLIPTRLAILQDGTVLTGLTIAEWKDQSSPVAKEINYIKMRLAAIDFRQESKEDEWRLEQISELDEDETVESLCAYYLSCVIKRSQDWIIRHRPELFENQTVRWSVNIGVPVEYCDSPALERFQRVLALSWLLKSADIGDQSLSVNELNDLMYHLQSWMDANDISKEDLDCFTTPEIAAAVWSFLNSRQAQEGFYTFFDVGDGTLDGAAFVFKQADGHRQVDFYSGQVEPLGVTAFVEKTADELSLSSESIRQSLSDESDRALQERMQNSKTRKKVQQLVASVVMEGNDKHHQTRKYSVQQDIGEKLKVFVGGGGGNTAFFPKAIDSTHGDFQQSNADIPPYEIREIPTPDDLSINGLDNKDFNRFAIAYGLCIPDGEGPTVQLPSQFATVESGGEIETHEPDSYEDTRDAM